MKRIFSLISLACLATVPLPIFIDLSTMDVVLHRESFPQAEIPVPVGLFGFAVAFGLYFLSSFLFQNEYKRFVSSSAGLVGGSIVIFLLLWSVFISGAGFLRAIQVYMPLLAILFMALPVNADERRLIARVVLWAFVLFVGLHITSLVLYAENWLEVSVYEFPMFFGFGIYQSLVTYTAVVSLYLVVVLGMALNSTSAMVFRIAMSFVAMMMLLLLSMGARRASLVEVLGIASLGILFMLCYFLMMGKVRKSTLAVLLVFSPILLFVNIIVSLPIFKRSLGTYQTGSFSGGRFDIYSKAVDELLSDYPLLLAGRGEPSGYHNFFLDLIYSIGLIPLIVFLVAMFYILQNGIARLYIKREKNYWLPVFVALSIALCLVVQSLVNASVTQPYYLINLIMAFLFLYFVPNWHSMGQQSNIQER